MNILTIQNKSNHFNILYNRRFRRVQVNYIMVKRKNQSKRIKQASKDYYRNNNNNSTEENKSKEKKKQSDSEESSSNSLAQREQEIKETIPEVFDSSRYNAMIEIKESASMQEKDMKEALSTTEKEEPRKTEIVNTETADNNVNTDVPTIHPLIEPQTSIVRESKEDEETKAEIIIPEYKNVQNIESYRKQENLNYPNIFKTSIALWQNYTMAWIVTYNEFVRNIGRMAEYWSNLFWNPSSAKEEEGHQQPKKDKTKV